MKITAVQDTLRNHNASWTHPDKFHITLAFLGNIETDKLDRLLENAALIAAPAFELELNSILALYRQKMLWLTPQKTPENLNQLISKLRFIIGETGISTKNQRFSAHVTLARKLRDRPTCHSVPTVRWPVNSFCLVESILGKPSACYKVRQQWLLK